MSESDFPDEEPQPIYAPAPHPAPPGYAPPAPEASPLSPPPKGFEDPTVRSRRSGAPSKNPNLSIAPQWFGCWDLGISSTWSKVRAPKCSTAALLTLLGLPAIKPHAEVAWKWGVADAADGEWPPHSWSTQAPRRLSGPVGRRLVYT